MTESQEQTTAQETTAILDKLQTISNIEGDLDQTAIAVAAAPTANDSEAVATDAAVSAAQDGSVVAANDDAGTSQLLENADAVESVLEQAIPPNPDHDNTEAIAMETSEQVNNVSMPSEVSGTGATESDDPPVPQRTDIPTSSLNIPSVPEIPVSAQDVPEITPIADPVTGIELSDPSVSNEEPVQPSTSVENSGNPPKAELSSDLSAVHFDASIPAELQHSGVNGLADPTTSSQIPIQTPYASLEVPQIDVDLPNGLTSESLTVRSHPNLIRAWKENPENSLPILELFTDAIQKTEIQDARIWYQTLQELEPTAIQPLLALVNLELALSNFSQVEQLFAKALKGLHGEITAAADVSIWKAYLHYIRRQNPITEGAANIDAVRNTVTKAYEFALKECGTDRESGDIWQEYINFISDTKPKNTWETQQQTDSLRKLYQRAVCVPLNNVEALWKAYDAFESGLNKSTAKKFLTERSPAYMTSRSALRELRALTDVLPHPPLPLRPTFSDQDRITVNAWKAYLKWEESDPLVTEDKSVLNTRITYALRKCLGEMRHFPELWHYAANWYSQQGDKEKASETLHAAVDACPSSYLLTFALADIEEERGNFTSCHQVYENLLNRLNPEIETLKETVAAEVDRARGPEITIPKDDVDMNGDDTVEMTRLIEEREARGKMVAERRGKDVEDLATAASVVWVMYMRFARRAEGIKAARGVFGKARKSPHLTWHTFEASAMMEYHGNKESSVAIRIFELGFKLFSEDVEYVMKYLQFLVSINDDTNARALFERSAAKIPADKARPLWDAWARYEYMYGDLTGVQKLESRFAEAFSIDSPLKRFAQRFIYNGIDEIALRDLGFARRTAGPPLPLAPVPSSLPINPNLPLPPHPSFNPIDNSINQNKRTYNESSQSPRNRRGRNSNSLTRSQSPSAKRYRPTQSPPGRRFPLPERERIPSGGAARYGRDERSPLPPAYPPNQARPYGAPPHAVPPGPPGPPVPTNMPPPRSSAGPGGPGYMPPGASDRFDRSGVTRPLAYFINSLPSARSFNGPVFRPDDIMHLFDSIAPNGTGQAGPPAGRAPYSEPPRGGGGYGPPQPRRY